MTVLRRPGSYAGQFVLVAVTYFLAARLSLELALVGEVVTPIWPPTGIALVALLAFGRRLWPAITVGAFLVNGPINPLGSAAVISAGNTLAPLLAAELLGAVGFRRELDRLRDALALVAGALVGMTVSATFGTGALWLSGGVSHQGLAPTWSVWWAGDATGILVFAPLLLTMRCPGGMAWRLRAEAVMLLLTLAVVSALAFRSGHWITYLVFPWLIWAAVRFGPLGASVATLVVVGTAVRGAIDGVGPFAQTTLLERMLTLQGFNAVAALTSFVLAAAMTERARAQQRQLGEAQALADALQRSLLPERLPDIPGITLAGRYRPGAAGLEVGGDWYDVFLLGGGKVGLTIGDVVGRGLAAAAAMGQLRSALRAYALQTDSPASVLQRLSGLVEDLDGAQMATALYAVLDPETGRLSFASAGHPPALLAEPDGTVIYLEEGRSPPLGVTGGPAQEHTVTLRPGSILVLYTDGLVETRHESIETGMEALRQCVAGHAGDLDSLCDDKILRSLGKEAPSDDVALLALRLLPVTGEALSLLLPAEPSVLVSLRRTLRQWLEEVGATSEDVDDLVLACDEAATNVLEHAYGLEDGTLEIEARAGPQEVSVTVRDWGQWRSPRGGDRGRGFRLMGALVDSVEVASGPSGTEVRLHRRIGRDFGIRPAAPTASPASEPGRRDQYPVEIVCLDGDVDLGNAARLEAQLSAAVGNQAAGLVIDLTNVRHLDSAGIRLLFRLAARLRQRRQQLAVVVGPGSTVERVLLLAQLETSVPTTSTVQEAVARVRPGDSPLSTTL